MNRLRAPQLTFGAAALAILAGCSGEKAPGTPAAAAPEGGPPDEVPVMLNQELPFRYPGALYEQRVQGNVTLRLFVDRDGRVLPESTRVEESSGYASFDSAAVTGSQELHFVPARLRGEPLPMPVLFPVYFRHPQAAPLPGDTILKGRTPTPDTLP
jgi:TonB family protein